jgi:predicted DNA-binding transcriptional regulator AlpA
MFIAFLPEMGGTMKYLSTEAYASARGVSAATIRRLANAGEIPGAVRISGTRGAWRFPDPTNDSTPPSDAGRGVSAESHEGPADIMSASDTQLLPIVLRVVERLDLVQSRPARALKATLLTAAAAAARHYPNRDGWCSACSWQYPCTDAKAAQTSIHEAAAIILDGAA